MKKAPLVTHVYIVDYDPVFSASLKKAIEKPHKYSILTFTTGEKFISHLTAHKFRRKEIHIVFLGYHFYDDQERSLMNGIEILEAAKVISPNIEVVMLYSPDESTYGAYARNSGAFDFVPKTDTIFLRINNIIMRIISRKELLFSKRAFFLSLRILFIYSAAATLIFGMFVLLRECK